MKVCSKCGIEKDNSCFEHYRNQCKDCRRASKKQSDKKYYESNKETINAKKKKYYQGNRQHLYEKQKEWRVANPDYMKEYLKEYNKEYKNNPKRIAYNKEYRQRPIVKLREDIRTLIRMSINKRSHYIKNTKTEQILGCTIDEFVEYIQSKFQEGMTLENHGEWHLDHIIPISTAKTEEEVIKLNHYTNYQPLWAEDNLKKSNKIV